MDLLKMLDDCPHILIADAFIITSDKVKKYDNIVCSISGGADSDIVLDICSKVDPGKKIRYVWFDTGLEYQATKDHLKYLEKKYNVTIEIIKAVQPIPITCRKIGQPFLNKRVSDYIGRLQKYNFKWEDRPFEELFKEYPKCKASLRWWCNNWGEDSRFNISRYRYLKEYMVANPPTFPISDKCCEFAKKKPVKVFISENNINLNMYGVRKAEGGARSTAYKNCFTDSNGGTDEYRPIFWITNDVKRIYEMTYDVTHSDCYTKYGLDRTGCAGCPFGKRFEKELEIIEKYEPKLFKAVNNIFGDSYEYTRNYYKFRKEQKDKEVE